MNALILTVFAAVLAASPALAGEALVARQKLFVDRDPAYARQFLAEDARRASAKAEDGEVFPALFQEALQLKDVQDILQGQFEAAPLRQALEKCPSRLCSHPQELMDWRKRYMPSVDEKRLSQAVAEWSALPEGPKAAVQSKGIGEAKWQTLLLSERKALIQAWGKARLAEFMKRSPKTSAELEAMRKEGAAIHEAVDHDDAVKLWDRYRQADAAVSALADAQKRVEKTGDPKLKAKLEKARAGGDLDAMLDDLNHLFDGIGVENKKLRAAAPAAKSQDLDEGQKQLLAAMLKRGLLDEIGGTWAGEDLLPYYKRKDLKLAIRPLDAGRIGEYHDSSQEIVFNQAFIDEYVRSNGLTPSKLLASAGALRSLSVQLSPLFVHEAYHQLQDDFAQGLKLPTVVAQHRELESMQVEALFVLQKMKHDPGFKKIMEDAQDGSKPARESLSKAARLEKGAGWMRDTIVTWHYPGVQSLEGWAASAINADRYYQGLLREELKRREALPIWSRYSLSGDKPFSSTHLSREQWIKELPGVGTKTIETLLKTYEASLAKLSGDYEAYERRLESVNRMTEARLAILKAGGGGPPKKPDAVPAPAGDRK